MNKRMFITDLQSWHPPFIHVGMIAIRDVQRSPTAHASFVAMIKILQAVQIMQVPENRSMFAVDFESIQGLVPTRITSRFKGGEGPVVKPGEESASIVDAHLLHFAGEVMFAFLD